MDNTVAWRAARIGSAAVALGVGAAIASGHGVASAESGVSAGADSSATQTSESAQGVSRGDHGSSAAARTESRVTRSEPEDDDPTERPARSPRAARVAQVTPIAVRASSPRAAEDEPDQTPVDSPASWAMLAGARREIGTPSAAELRPEEPRPRYTTVAPAAEFTGQSSPFNEVLVAGLRAIKPILGLAGIELNGTTARVPFFTDGIPPAFVTQGLDVSSTDYHGWKVWTLASQRPSEKVVIGVHGGSFISTASLFHWWMYADLVRATDATVVVPLYPLADEDGTGGTARTVVPGMADFIADQVLAHGSRNVSVLGDSAGGNIALAAAQELVRRCAGEDGCLATVLPGHIVLLAPALDAGADNPAIDQVDDPLLNPDSSRRNGRWWARGLESPEDPDGTHHPMASPLFGSLEDLPPVAVYAGSRDLRTPDVLVLQQRVAATPGADFTFRLRSGQIHDWVIFGFLPDAQAERPNVYRDLGLRSAVAPFY